MTTEEHIENIKTIKRQMRNIRKVIEDHGENEAFELVMSKVGGWMNYVKQANEHVIKAELHLAESFSIEKLDSLIEKLEMKKIADQYGI